MVAWQTSSATASNFPDPVGMCLTVNQVRGSQRGIRSRQSEFPIRFRVEVLQRLEGICEPQLSPAAQALKESLPLNKILLLFLPEF